MPDLQCSESSDLSVSCCDAATQGAEAVFDDRAAQILDPVVNQLFSVTMRLAAMATEQNDSPPARRLLGAVREIDDAIRRLRADLITELMAASPACEAEHVSWD